MAPVVSYVIPAYNHEKYVGAAINSVLNQTFSEFELIVVDDCSVDGTFNIARSFSDPRIRLFRNDQNLGNSATLNRAIQASRGRFIAHVGSDDWIDPRKTERQLAWLHANTNTSVVGTWMRVIDGDGKPHPDAEDIEAVVNQNHDFNQINAWSVKNNLCHSSTMVRREFHTNFGLYDTSMTRALDFDLWMRGFYGGAKFSVIPEKLTSYRLQEGSLTHGDAKETFLEMIYLMGRNIFPSLFDRAISAAALDVLDWCLNGEEFRKLPNRQRWRLLGRLVQGFSFKSYGEFYDWFSSGEGDLVTERMGLILSDSHDRYERVSSAAAELERRRTKLVAAIDELRKVKAHWFAPDKAAPAPSETVLWRQVAGKGFAALYSARHSIRPRKNLLARTKQAIRMRLSSAARDADEREAQSFVLREALKTLNLFDPDWYLAHNPDLASAHADPLEHYVRHGYLENRSPGPWFDARSYVRVYPDAAESGMPAILHYLLHGISEGREPLLADEVFQVTPKEN